MIGLKKKVEQTQQQQLKEDEKKPDESTKMEVEGESKTDNKPTDTPASSAPKPAAGGRGRGGVSIWNPDKKKAEGGGGGKRGLKPGEIRVQKDVGELDAGECAVANFPNPNDLMNFEVVITPNDGYWSGYSYKFTFTIPDMYPHDAPKVHCDDPIYHPNIDLKGNVCLNILRADWKPVLDLNTVIIGLIVLFEKPNGDDPLNHDAAKCLRESPAKFKTNVERSLKGLDVDGVSFPPARKGIKKS